MEFSPSYLPSAFTSGSLPHLQVVIPSPLVMGQPPPLDICLGAKPNHLCQASFTNLAFVVLGLIPFYFQTVIFFFFSDLAFSPLKSS